MAGVILARADQPHDILRVINQVATGLTNGDPSDALTPFSQSFSKYETMRNYFAALTSAFDITNEVNVLDEEDAPAETKLTVEWSLNLNSRATNENLRRVEQVQIRLSLADHNWKIVDFSPISLFDPQARPVGK